MMRSKEIKAAIAELNAKYVDACIRYANAIQAAKDDHRDAIGAVQVKCRHRWSEWKWGGYYMPNCRRCKICGKEDNR